MDGYIKSPINYTGNKYKLLGGIIPLFPKGIGTFVDVFGGSGTVTLNASAKNYIYNEKAEWVFSMFEGLMHDGDAKTTLDRIDSTIREYGLNKTDEAAYTRIRNDYNNGRNDWVTLYVLCCHAFNAQGRFNTEGKFNMPFGKDRSWFSEAQRENIERMKKRFADKRVRCTNLSFDKVDYSALSEGDLAYFDPPYYGSVAVYNEKNGWTMDDERKLAGIVDGLDARGIKFAISNNLKYGNEVLENLCKRYNTVHLGSKYNNSSYHKKDKHSADDEVLVTNFATDNGTLF